MNVVNGGIEIQNQVIFDIYNVLVYLFWYYQRKEWSYPRTRATSTGVIWTAILVFFKDTLFSLSRQNALVEPYRYLLEVFQVLQILLVTY